MDTPADPATSPLLPADALRTGDVLLMLGEGPLSELIAWASDGPYSHAALVADGGDLIEAATAGVRRYPLATRLADQANYHYIDAMRMHAPQGPLDPADGAAVLAKAVALLGTPYPIDQLALFGAIMAVRGKWPEHPWGRLLVRVALDHALPQDTGRTSTSPVAAVSSPTAVGVGVVTTWARPSTRPTSRRPASLTAIRLFRPSTMLRNSCWNWLASPRANPGHAADAPRSSAMTLKSSPISAGDSSLCTAPASRRYAADVGSPIAASRSRSPQPMRNAACVA